MKNIPELPKYTIKASGEASEKRSAPADNDRMFRSFPLTLSLKHDIVKPKAGSLRGGAGKKPCGPAARMGDAHINQESRIESNANAF